MCWYGDIEAPQYSTKLARYTAYDRAGVLSYTIPYRSEELFVAHSTLAATDGIVANGNIEWEFYRGAGDDFSLDYFVSTVPITDLGP